MATIMGRESSWWEDNGEDYGKRRQLVGGQWQQLWEGRAVGRRKMMKIIAREGSWWKDNGYYQSKAKRLVGGQCQRSWKKNVDESTMTKIMARESG